MSSLEDGDIKETRDQVVVSNRWNELSHHYNIPENVTKDVWKIIQTYYEESQRHYHTLKHIASLLQLSLQYSSFIKNKFVVNMAIIFHDLIYEPTKSDNEEQSANMFKALLGEYLPQTDADKVYHYIIITKSHLIEGEDASDWDLQYFIDFDMSILGSDPLEIYMDYAHQVRQEYIHVSANDYCAGRSKFLVKLVADSENQKSVFSTEVFRSMLEEHMRRNIRAECALLEAGIVP